MFMYGKYSHDDTDFFFYSSSYVDHYGKIFAPNSTYTNLNLNRITCSNAVYFVPFT